MLPPRAGSGFAFSRAGSRIWEGLKRLLPLAQGGRGDLPQHHSEERHPAGRQGAAGVRQVSQAAAGGGGGDGESSVSPAAPGRGSVGRFKKGDVAPF